MALGTSVPSPVQEGKAALAHPALHTWLQQSKPWGSGEEGEQHEHPCSISEPPLQTFPIPRCLLPVVLFPKQRRKAPHGTHRPQKFGWRSHGLCLPLSAPPLHRKGCTRRGLAAGLKPGAYWQAKRMRRRRNPGGERRGHPAITVTLPCPVSL